MSKVFSHILEWNTLTIQAAICDQLVKRKYKFENSMGFADSGESAFIITATKGKFAILIYLENEDKKIRIKAGIAGKYLPIGKQTPKYSKVFSHLEIKQASEYFEKIVEDNS